MIDRLRAHVLALPRRWKQGVLVCFDFVALSIALWASFSLRYDNWYTPNSAEQWAAIFFGPVIAIPIFIRLGLYRAVVRFLPERAIWTVLQAMLIATVAWVVMVFLSQLSWRLVVPRSVPIIYFGIGTAIIGGSRYIAKWIFRSRLSRSERQHNAIVIYGAGEAGIQLAQSLRSTRHIAGFLDDNPELQRRELAGVRVYEPSKLKDLVNDHNVNEVILTIPSLTASRRKEIVASVSLHGLKIRTLPALADVVTGKYLVSQIKEIDVIELLGRSSVPPDPTLIRQMVVGRSIMVTGAGGSIGSELCRKIARWNPSHLVLFEANEFALYQIEQELADLPDIVVIPVLGSVTQQSRVEQALTEHSVQVVFHAAAHKHVPLVEANVLEGIYNNVFGTATVAATAFAHGVDHFVLISTDKAVRPTNVMGATKRWAEIIVGDYANRCAKAKTDQRFCTVRFGNVLGSNGSVVPLFKKQIAQGGPVTLTDVAMTRYFMSIEEAAELIVQAGALSEGGDVFLLDMGDSMLISELAENMIRLSGLTVRGADNPGGDIEIVITGKRPGEKMYEELFYDAATAESTAHAKIMRTPSQSTVVDIAASILLLRNAVETANKVEARRILFDVVGRSG